MNVARLYTANHHLLVLSCFPRLSLIGVHI